MTTRSAQNPLKFAFFGTDPLAEEVLNALERADMRPTLVVASPDKTARDRSVVFPTEKKWAQERGIAVMQPHKISQECIDDLAREEWDLFVVASYGKILRRALLDIPKRGTLNVHPSLLPRLRGPSPIRSAILRDEKETGVSVMLLDDEMDHGPLLAQRSVLIVDWPPRGRDLDALLAREGGTLLAEVVPQWMSGMIKAQEQDHSKATYCSAFTKEDGKLDLIDGDPYQNLLKIRAFDGWPGTFAYFERNGERIRVSIIDAHLKNGALVIDMVKPEGKREMPYADFMRSGARPAR
ncbi:MAG TPA: methionyl-tRNA formyltransferase [Candidatus Paceibacterota bacterium]|nr:methionyl-tRNA formyltransferase [Candidatus Paceibacterota bacterium]